MTRFLAFTVAAVFVVGLWSVTHRHTLHILAAGVPGPSTAASASPVRAVEKNGQPVTVTPHRASRSHRTHCTTANYRTTLGRDERWIDRRESHIDPHAIEPTTGAYGIGQLLPRTYALLGLVESADPCAQIVAQRAYDNERYGGSWAKAKAHELAVSWW